MSHGDSKIPSFEKKEGAVASDGPQNKVRHPRLRLMIYYHCLLLNKNSLLLNIGGILMHAFNNHPPVSSDKDRAKLAKMLIRLFELWQLDTESQLTLLGLSPSSRAMLSRYRQGTTPLPFAKDILDRAGWLLAIHQALRSLYPKNTELCYNWIKLHNTLLQNQIPLDYMKYNGLIGIAKIARYLQSQLVK